MANPYRDVPDYQMWRRAVSRVEPHRLDPAVMPKFQVTPDMRVATAGSCFAQHISRRLAELGFNYFVPESGATLDEAERKARQFGVFSARFGNLYTVHQLDQLFAEVFEGRSRAEPAWQRPDGRYVDPFRPQVEPEGYDSPEEVARARRLHLEAVREMFLQADLFVFTLGLTEAWRSRADDSVFPLAPGVVAGSFDPECHEFHNFSVAETSTTLSSFLTRLRQVNPDVRVLLTVSPVPLIATFEPRHVLSSTTYSKAVLRVAAQEACDAFDFVDYFPSFEIITSSATGGLYYEPDQREVNLLGVAHAMRCFVSAYTDQGRPEAPDREVPGEMLQNYASASAIVCDEEAIDTAGERR
ncbi:GSCFA domain-containing protein [Salipiger sp. PrR002]|uniref:GSCFA domain-containing protein n=1 Tax=Salipiger sp. PrR002 TaxID=2706489 RepID=UPI0013B9AFD3|nr:GSCFA domain-containing protein [Salipiger sp. PrR002]NDW01340.1 GSCFA domain-containing protein [Salipiger sp. PrR002]NDW58871.1 GSCFA domain-containing protein [Salipiger sp. PrR004]